MTSTDFPATAPRQTLTCTNSTMTSLLPKVTSFLSDARRRFQTCKAPRLAFITRADPHLLQAQHSHHEIAAPPARRNDGRAETVIILRRLGFQLCFICGRPILTLKPCVFAFAALRLSRICLVPCFVGEDQFVAIYVQY